jgi:hypothetical protein
MFIKYIAVLLKNKIFNFIEENYKTVNEYYAASMQYFSF